MSTDEPSTQTSAVAESAANLKSDGLSQPATKAGTPKAAGSSVSATPSSPSPTSTASASTNFSDSATSAPANPPPAKEARPAADGHPRPAAKKGEKRAAPKAPTNNNNNSDPADGDIATSNPGLNLGGGGGSSKRKRTVAQLKHSQVEQKRRNRMNAHYMELDSLCLQLDPSLTNVKRNRDAVLVNAIRLLKDFQSSLTPANSVRNALGIKANGAAAAAAVAALRDGQSNPAMPSASTSAMSQADTSKLLDQALFPFRNFPNDAATLLALQQDPLRAQNIAAAAAALSGRPTDRLGADNTHDRLSQALGAYYHSSFLGGQPQLLSSLQQSGMNLHHLGSTPSPLPPDYMSLHMLSNNSLPGLSAIDRLTGQANPDLNLLRSLANNNSSSSLASMAASMASGNFFPQATPAPAGPAPAQNHSSSQFMLQ